MFYFRVTSQSLGYTSMRGRTYFLKIQFVEFNPWFRLPVIPAMEGGDRQPQEAHWQISQPSRNGQLLVQREPTSRQELDEGIVRDSEHTLCPALSSEREHTCVCTTCTECVCIPLCVYVCVHSLLEYKKLTLCQHN